MTEPDIVKLLREEGALFRRGNADRLVALCTNAADEIVTLREQVKTLEADVTSWKNREARSWAAYCIAFERAIDNGCKLRLVRAELAAARAEAEPSDPSLPLTTPAPQP